MSLLDPPRRRKLVFMLTPLVDVMFLLLIFFMVSSQTSPYSLLDILAAGPSAPPNEAPAPAPAPQAEAQSSAELLISIGNGFVRVNGARIDHAMLGAALERFKQSGISRAVVLPSRTATVQDIVTVVETFSAAAFSDVQILATAAPE